MRRVRYHSHGGPEVLVTEEADIPQPGPGQVLIRSEAIGTNYVDVQLRRETDPDSMYFRSLPATVTGDVVGTVEQVGPDADPALVGSRVAVLLEDAYADYVVAATDWLARVPDRLGPGAASMLPTVGAVAFGALHTARLAEGETVLVTAGAGAIGHIAVQLARQQGAGTVIATAGSPAKLDFLTSLGADVTVNHREADWADQVRKAAPGGVDVVLEAVGGQMLRASVGLLAPFGRVVVFGALGRRVVQRAGEEPVRAEYRGRVFAARLARGRPGTGPGRHRHAHRPLRNGQAARRHGHGAPAGPGG
jgi:NADPH:quinone reductase